MASSIYKYNFESSQNPWQIWLMLASWLEWEVKIKNIKNNIQESLRNPVILVHVI